MRAIDPIDRIELMEKLGIGKECTVCEQNSEPYCKWKPDVVDVCEAICTAPTIEPRCETCEAFNKTRLLIPQPQRKKGMWIEHNPHKWGLGIVFECSECGEKIDCEPSNFCPNCGADMQAPEEQKKCDTCQHEREPWSMQCHRCEDYNLWEGKQ